MTCWRSRAFSASRLVFQQFGPERVGKGRRPVGQADLCLRLPRRHVTLEVTDPGPRRPGQSGKPILADVRNRIGFEGKGEYRDTVVQDGGPYPETRLVDQSPFD